MPRTSDRLVAEGADRFRRPGALERVAARLARMRFAPGVRRSLRRAYELALTVQTGGQGLACTLPGGETVRVLPRYAGLTWNPDEYRAFRDAARPGMVALDVGANVGSYTMLLGRWAGPSGRVFSFEPAPRLFKGLSRHVRLNHLDATVTPVCSAVGARSTMGRLLVAGTAGESRLAGASEGGDTMAVAVTSIDDFCAREGVRPDFIKIDVEGAELDVLRGARRVIAERRGALALFVEMHPSIWRAAGLTVADLKDELRAQRLEVEPLVPAADPWAIEGVCLRLVAR